MKDAATSLAVLLAATGNKKGGATMLFYDIDPFGTPLEPKPLTDEEYNQRVETYKVISADYKERLRKALGSRQAHKLEKFTQDFICREAYTELDFETWKVTLESVSMVTCGHYLSAVIRFTPKKYAHEWTAEKIDEKAQILGLSEQSRYYVFEDAGLPCEEPESIIRARQEYEKSERERKERLEQFRREREAREAELDKKWTPRLKEIEGQLAECEKNIIELRGILTGEGAEIVTATAQG